MPFALKTPGSYGQVFLYPRHSGPTALPIGRPPRPTIRWGFDPEYASADTKAIAIAFREKFSKVVELGDLESIRALFVNDSHWKDVILLT